MERFRERRRFKDSLNKRHEISSEVEMSDPNEMLSLEEAERRARLGADQLDEVINKVDKTRDKVDNERHTKLISLLMSFLADKHGIEPPDSAKSDINSK